MTSRVVLVDRQPLRRAWVMASLDGWELGSPVSALAEVAELASYMADRATRIDLVILSIGSASVVEGAVAEDLRWLKTHLPEVPVALLAERDDRETILGALRAGVRGYLPTSIDPQVARRALALVLAGGSYAPPGALLGAAGGAHEPSQGQPAALLPQGRLKALTQRQREVLALLGEGRPNKVIAKRLSLCESTVKVHVRQIMRKLGAANRTEVALKMRELSGAAG